MQLNKIFFNSVWSSVDDETLQKWFSDWKENNKKSIESLAKISGISSKKVNCSFCGKLEGLKNDSFVLIPAAMNKAYFCFISDASDIPYIEESIVEGKDSFLFDKTFYSKDFLWFKEKCEFYDITAKNLNYKGLIKQIDDVKYDETHKLHRDQNIVKEFKNKVPEKCMICGMTSTFKDSRGNQYFEVHHVIPYDTITKEIFPSVNLDCISNLALLCPTCHKKIHLSDAPTRRQCISILLESNNRNTSFWNNLLGTKLDNDELNDIINEVYRKIFKFAE